MVIFEWRCTLVLTIQVTAGTINLHRISELMLDATLGHGEVIENKLFLYQALRLSIDPQCKLPLRFYGYVSFLWSLVF